MPLRTLFTKVNLTRLHLPQLQIYHAAKVPALEACISAKPRYNLEPLAR